MPPARQADPLTIKRLQRGEEPWHIEIIKRDCTILSVPYTINRAKLKGLGLTLSEQDRRSTFTSPLYNNGKKCYAMLKCSRMPEEDASVVNNLVLHDLHPFIHSDTKMRKHVLFLVSNVKRLLAARKLEKAHDFPDFPGFHDMPQDHHLASFTPPPEMHQVNQKVEVSGGYESWAMACPDELVRLADGSEPWYIETIVEIGFDDHLIASVPYLIPDCRWKCLNNGAQDRDAFDACHLFNHNGKCYTMMKLSPTAQRPGSNQTSLYNIIVNDYPAQDGGINSREDLASSVKSLVERKQQSDERSSHDPPPYQNDLKHPYLHRASHTPFEEEMKMFEETTQCPNTVKSRPWKVEKVINIEGSDFLLASYPQIKCRKNYSFCAIGPPSISNETSHLYQPDSSRFPPRCFVLLKLLPNCEHPRENDSVDIAIALVLQKSSVCSADHRRRLRIILCEMYPLEKNSEPEKTTNKKSQYARTQKKRWNSASDNDINTTQQTNETCPERNKPFQLPKPQSLQDAPAQSYLPSSTLADTPDPYSPVCEPWTVEKIVEIEGSDYLVASIPRRVFAHRNMRNSAHCTLSSFPGVLKNASFPRPKCFTLFKLTPFSDYPLEEQKIDSIFIKKIRIDSWKKGKNNTQAICLFWEKKWKKLKELYPDMHIWTKTSIEDKTLAEKGTTKHIEVSNQSSTDSFPLATAVPLKQSLFSTQNDIPPVTTEASQPPVPPSSVQSFVHNNSPSQSSLSSSTPEDTPVPYGAVVEPWTVEKIVKIKGLDYLVASLPHRVSEPQNMRAYCRPLSDLPGVLKNTSVPRAWKHFSPPKCFAMIELLPCCKYPQEKHKINFIVLKKTNQRTRRKHNLFWSSRWKKIKKLHPDIFKWLPKPKIYENIFPSPTAAVTSFPPLAAAVTYPSPVAAVTSFPPSAAAVTFFPPSAADVTIPPSAAAVTFFPPSASPVTSLPPPAAAATFPPPAAAETPFLPQAAAATLPPPAAAVTFIPDPKKRDKNEEEEVPRPCTEEYIEDEPKQVEIIDMDYSLNEGMVDISSGLEAKFACICYDPRSGDSGSSLSREACPTCMRHIINLVSIVKEGGRTYFLGETELYTGGNGIIQNSCGVNSGGNDINSGVKFIKILSSSISSIEYSFIGLESVCSDGRGRVLFFTDANIVLSQLKTGILPGYQLLRCNVTQTNLDVCDLERVFSKSAVQSCDDSFSVYCDQPLSSQHAECQVCRDNHINLHWDQLSGGKLWSSVKYFNSKCKCPVYKAKPVGPYKNYGKFRVYLAQIVDLPPNTHSVVFQPQNEAFAGSPVVWDENQAYVGIPDGHATKCKIRCLPDRLRVNFDRIEELVCHRKTFPGISQCRGACQFIGNLNIEK